MEKLKTATGKEFKCDDLSVIDNPRRMYIRIFGESIATIATIFGDPKETIQIWFENQYLAHYTKVIAIVPETNAIRVVLGKE